ncbi:MAG TPA: hypothetical protein VF190_15720 [Rhodothermales bacterium]
MSRFQLIFRDARGERSEIHDNNLYDEPRIDGKPIVDGETYKIGGSQWVIRSTERLDGMARFVCTLASG